MERKFIFVIFWLILPIGSIAFAQSTKPEQVPKTKLETFVAQNGIVIIQGFSSAGILKGQYGSTIEVDSKEFTNAASGKKEYGITIEVSSGGTASRSNRSYIDYDEIESLIKGLDYIAKIDKSVTKLESFQATYNTKDDLSFAIFSRDNGTIMLSVESGRIGAASAYFKYDEIGKVRDLITQAKIKIDGIK